MQNAELRSSGGKTHFAFCILRFAFADEAGVDAAFRLRRVCSPFVPFPEDCLATPNQPPTPERTDGAGTRHLIEPM
jgi:hypothetical protein